jgi:hypothetical protein
LTILALETLSVTRRSGDYVSGKFVPVLDETFTIRANVQPMPARQLELLPEAARTRGAFMCFSDNRQRELRVLDQATKGLPDRVTRSNGRTYQVHSLGDWTSHTSGLPHRAYSLIAVGDDEP